ncbi:MAG: hypothetical protein HYY61_05905 [Deltaproteobacteria bacterium]|nr:hypothetical protein [Deltaproteobacteria bacterium]
MLLKLASCEEGNIIKNHYPYFLSLALLILITACDGRERRWSPPGPPDPRLLTSIPEGHHSHQATVTEDGQKVVVSGGYESRLTPSQNVFTYDVYTRNTLDVAGMPIKADLFEPRALHAQALVTTSGGAYAPRGSIVIVGGQSGDIFGPSVSATADVYVPASPYNPNSDYFISNLGNLKVPRKNHTITEITDPSSFFYGHFLIVGGQNNSGAILSTAEIFDPGTGRFTYVNDRLIIAREEHTAVALKTGKVLIAGGNTQFGATDTGEIFDPVTLTFTPVPNRMSDARRYHTATYIDNKTPESAADDAVLIAGGLDDRGFVLDSADFYDPFFERFVPVGSRLPHGVFRHAAAALPQSFFEDAAITGGFTDLNFSNTLRSNPTEQVVIFNYMYTGGRPDGYFVRTTNMLRARALHTTNHVKQRALLTIGGVDIFGDPRSTAEEFNY